jgi:hypothetical protein
MVEENVDRFAPGEQGGGIVPWRNWKVTESQMSSSAKAIEFYTPPFIADKLIGVYNHFSKIADDHSGVPAYAHGDTAVGGAGNTLGGFSMMIGQAGKGIKQGVRNIDINIIQDVVQRQYNYNLANEELFGLVGDYKIVPKGFAALMAKEQQAIRKLELLNNSNNPVDLQIMGLDGRKELWREAFAAMEMDSALIFPEGQPMLPAPPAAANPMSPNAGPETLDPAGNRVVGQDTRMNNPEKPKGRVSTKGDSGTANKGK